MHFQERGNFGGSVSVNGCKKIYCIIILETKNKNYVFKIVLRLNALFYEIIYSC